jgi:hypothetical protein
VLVTISGCRAPNFTSGGALLHPKIAPRPRSRPYEFSLARPGACKSLLPRNRSTRRGWFLSARLNTLAFPSTAKTGWLCRESRPMAALNHRSPNPNRRGIRRWREWQRPPNPGAYRKAAGSGCRMGRWKIRPFGCRWPQWRFAWPMALKSRSRLRLPGVAARRCAPEHPKVG